MTEYLRLLRIKHYIKNFLIFLPLIFSRHLFDVILLPSAIAGFISFCLISSVVYIINDICDINNDRNHPVKNKRPIAQGTVQKKNALIIAAVLFILSLISGIVSCTRNFSALIFILLYFILNVLYSIRLKNIPVIDIAILVSGFLLRILFGSAITQIEISKWLYLTVISAAFYFGLGKRRNELKHNPINSSRKVLQYYSYGFLDKNMYICMALTITFYSLWCVDSLTIIRTGSKNLIWTVPLVILICLKYSLNIENNSDADPIEVLFRDKLLFVLMLIFILIVLCILYL